MIRTGYLGGYSLSPSRSVWRLGIAFVEARDGDLTNRANRGVYLCADAYYGGHCAYITASAGVCGKSYLPTQIAS